MALDDKTKPRAKLSSSVSSAPAVWVVAQEVCEKLSSLSRDDQRRVLAACATMLGIYEEKP